MDPLGVVVGKKRSMERSMVERESNLEVQNKKGRVMNGSEEKNFELVEAGSQPHQLQ